MSDNNSYFSLNGWKIKIPLLLLCEILKRVYTFSVPSLDTKILETQTLLPLGTNTYEYGGDKN